MPQVTKAITTPQEVDVGYDCDGAQVEKEDWVILKLVVSMVHPVIDGETGLEKGQNVRLSHVKPSGYREHLLVCDSKLVKKAT